MSNVIDWQLAKKKVEDLKIADFKKKQPFLFEYVEERKKALLLASSVATFLQEFEEKVLCYTVERAIPMEQMTMYIMFKMIAVEMKAVLKERDDEVKLHYPSFDPDHETP